jgi:predicted Zn-dependent protease
MIEKIINEGLVRGFSTVEVFFEKDKTSIFENFFDYEAQHHKNNNNAIVRCFRRTGEPVGFQISDPTFNSIKDAFFEIYTVDSDKLTKNSSQLLPGSVKKINLNIYDKDFNKIETQYFKDMTERCYEAVIKYPKLNIKKISFQKTEKKIYIFNSRGLRAKYKKTFYNLSLNLNRDNKSIKVSEFNTHNTNISPEKAMLRGQRILNSITDNSAPYSKNCFFILSPEASIHLLRTFQPYFQIHSRHKIKNLKFPSILNITDNPFLDYEPGSVPFDDEGIQNEAKFLIEKGKIRERISSIRDGILNNHHSTGNGFRTSFSIFPQTSFTNLFINPTTLPLKHLMQTNKEGIFITLLKLVHIKNTFCYFLAFGYRFLEGELREPVHFTLKTSFNSYFLSILKISKGIRFNYELSNTGSPHILTEGKLLSTNYFKI